MRTLEDRIRRIEALRGLASVPKEWGITIPRIKKLRDDLGIGINEARTILVKSYGARIPEEGAENE